MNRLGLPGSELASLAADHAKRLEGIRLVLFDEPAGMLGRGRRQDEPRSTRPFQDRAGDAAAAPASLASSGGLMLGRDYLFDMVRPGIGLYGAIPTRRSPIRFW